MSERITSEDELIARYLRPLSAGCAGAFDLSDDCAALTVPEGQSLITTVDTLVADVHFFAGDAPADIGWKALSVNVSDLASKGAIPLAYVMSLAFPEPPECEWMEGFCSGMREAQDAYGLMLAGGDTVHAPGSLAISITAFGLAPEGRGLLRRDAHSGDVLFVSGTLGDAALGCRLRKDPSLAQAWGLSPEQADCLVRAYLRPLARVALREPLLKFASAAMDLSDGLLKDLKRLCAASSTGAAIPAAQLPLSPPVSRAVAADPSCWPLIVTGGDDYEILAAIPASLAEDFRVSAGAAGVQVTEIGALDESADVMFANADGRRISFVKDGWDHFD